METERETQTSKLKTYCFTLHEERDREMIEILESMPESSWMAMVRDGLRFMIRLSFPKRRKRPKKRASRSNPNLLAEDPKN